MATRRLETTIDDLDGTAGAARVVFSLGGDSYEIDLSDANAERLRAALSPFIEAGRRLSRSGQPYVRVNLDDADQRRRR